MSIKRFNFDSVQRPFNFTSDDFKASNKSIYVVTTSTAL